MLPWMAVTRGASSARCAVPAAPRPMARSSSGLRPGPARRAPRAGEAPPGLCGEVPARRLQHEHSMTVLRDQACELRPGERVHGGFFGVFIADHPDATQPADLARVAATLALAEAQ